ncbi:MAG: ABC transporter permease, partial [Ardenticatenia bacterium]|nr:ABC transporter permease [Ardenticatenia bacterium]
MKLIAYLLRRNRIGLIGALIVLIFAVMALAPDLFAPHDPLQMFDQARLAPPDRQFPLGTDRYGRDILSRIAHGTRISFE